MEMESADQVKIIRPSKQKEYVAKYFRDYYSKHASEFVHCDVCKKEVKKLQLSKHLQGKFHKLLTEIQKAPQTQI